MSLARDGTTFKTTARITRVIRHTFEQSNKTTRPIGLHRGSGRYTGTRTDAGDVSCTIDLPCSRISFSGFPLSITASMRREVTQLPHAAQEEGAGVMLINDVVGSRSGVLEVQVGVEVIGVGVGVEVLVNRSKYSCRRERGLLSELLTIARHSSL